MRGEEQRKIAYQGRVVAVQPRSNVWRYRLDNRTHSHTGYNIFLIGEADGEERDFAMVLKVARITRWEDLERFHIRIVAVLMTKAGWMKFVRRIVIGMSR